MPAEQLLDLARLRDQMRDVLRALFPADPPTEVTPAVLHNAVQEASALHDAQAGNLRELEQARARVAEQDETIGELKEELALTRKVAATADHLLAGREIQPTTINTWLAHRFRTGLEARTAELATAQQRVDKLEAAAVANARRWTQELGRLGLRANTADTQLAAALDRLDQVRGELATTQHDHAAATARIRDLRAAATAAHQCADAAEAQVAAVRALLDGQPCHCAAPAQFGHRAECPRIRIHVHVIRRALDAAGTPELASEPASSLEVHGQGASGVASPPRTGEHDWRPEIIPIVDALRGLDWADFDPTRLDDLADVAAVIAPALPALVTDAMVRAAEVAYALHPGTPSGATKRASIRAALEAALIASTPAETSPTEPSAT